MYLHDSYGQITKRKKTNEGFLLVSAKIARTGIQDYYAGEKCFVDDEYVKQFPPDSIMKVLRIDDEVFDNDSMQSFANKSITCDHPEQFVNSINFKNFQIGLSRDNVKRDGDYLIADLIIQDESAIKKIENGMNQISNGYECDIDWTSGVHDQYGPYDGIQRNIRGNHIALVGFARGGSNLKLDDKKPKEKNKMATRVIDGLTIEVTDQAGEVIDKLQSEIKKKDEKINKLDVELKDSTKKCDTLQGELDAKKLELDKSKDVVVIDKLVQDRMDLVEKAKGLYKDVDATGKTATEIKTIVINEVAKDLVTDNKSAEYIDAVFDTLTATIQESRQIADAMIDNAPPKNLVKDARSKFIEKNKDAWKGGNN